MAAVLMPGHRGEFSCLCTGHIEETKGRYGWIIPYSEIGHPDIWRHQGRVYLDPSDICPGSQLKKGDAVQFYLYADQDGLGAEDCRAAPATHNEEFGVSAMNATFLMFADCFDDSDEEGEEEVAPLGAELNRKGVDKDFGDSDSTTCGSRSTKSSPGEVHVDFDGSNDEDNEQQLQDELQAELRAAREAAGALKAEVQHDDLQAELKAARAQAQQLEENLQRDSLQAELRAARAEAGRLAADLQKENLQVELQEARAQAGQLAAKLEAVGISALEMAAQNASKEAAAVAKFAELPSKGSVLHASGQCRRCNFFSKGCCSKGKDCCFCHFPHDKQDSRKTTHNQSAQNGAVKKTEIQSAPKASKRQVATPAVSKVPMPPPPGLLKVIGAPPGLEGLVPQPEIACLPCGKIEKAVEVDPFESELQAELRAAREQARLLASGIQK